MALSSNCWKYLVLTFNILFAMSAVALFCISGFLLYKLFVYRHFIGVNVEYPSILLLMMSIITCSIAWIGWRTSKSMHQIHVILTALLIILVVVIEFSCFVWAMVVWDNIEIDIKTTMTSYFMMTNENKETNTDAVRWDRLHVKFECCGVSGPNDYSNSGHVPFSCCGQGPLESLQRPYASDCSSLYQRGCGKLLHEYAKQQLLWVAMTALVASLLQLDIQWTVTMRMLHPHPGFFEGVELLFVLPCLFFFNNNRQFKKLSEYNLHSKDKKNNSVGSKSLIQMTSEPASTGIFCTFFLAHAIKEQRRASLRQSVSVRENFAPDDSLLASPTAPNPTLPKY